MKRLFFALLPDNATVNALQTMISKLDDTVCNRVDVNNLHVTLAFMGAVPDYKLALLRRNMQGVFVAPFDITFDQFLYWPKAEVICIGSTDPAKNLMRLAETLNRTLQNCAIETDSRAYVPHITLARKARQAQALHMQTLQWRVKGFYLLESIRVKGRIEYPIVDSWLFPTS